jgi:hypothetical protein
MGNDRTMTLQATDFQVPPRLACEELVARATLAAEALPPARVGVVFRVFWEDAAAPDATAPLAFADLHVEDHLVVGRHSACDVRLSHPSVALRHVLVRARVAEGDRVALVLSDLGTDAGFRIGPLQASSRGVSCDGPTVLGVSTHLLVALPTTATGTADESALRPRVIDADPAAARPIAYDRAALAVRTQIDLISRTLIRPFAAPLPVEILASSERPFARLALRGPDGRVVIAPSRADLDALVLVGRYPRCRHGELSPFSGGVSRVHAAITREGDALRVIDLASTNGIATRTEEGVVRARAIRVASRASIRLGSSDDRLDVEIVGAEDHDA